jgi:hypothetical protein
MFYVKYVSAGNEIRMIVENLEKILQFMG